MAETTALLGLDIGTMNCKLVAYSTSGQVIAQAVGHYNIQSPRPGHAELKPSDIIATVFKVFQKISPFLSSLNDLLLSISAQGEAFVLVDERGNPLTAIPISLDLRGKDIITVFGQRDDVNQARKEAGQTFNSLTSLSKLLWLKEHCFNLLNKTSQVLCVGEYVMKVLGLEPVMDYSMASRMGLLDNYKLEWSQDLISLAGLPPSIFPPVKCAGQYVGTIDKNKTGELGLNKSVRVYTGGHDQA